MLNNLKLLKEDMESKGWIIDGFAFSYKKHDYIVLAKLYNEHQNKPPFSLLKLQFIDKDDETRTLETNANSNGLIIDAKSLRQFFSIEYSENLGDILQQFTNYLNNFIPNEVNTTKSNSIKNAMIKSLSISDSEDPEKVYCYAVKRNGIVDGKQRYRSPYNDNKTRILRKKLYLRFKDDKTISFCYSKNQGDEKNDPEIISNFVVN